MDFQILPLKMLPEKEDFKEEINPILKKCLINLVKVVQRVKGNDKLDEIIEYYTAYHNYPFTFNEVSQEENVNSIMNSISN